MVGVKSQTISAYEHDKGTPGPDVMASLAGVLNFPLAFFVRPAPREAAAPIFWRANSTATRIAQERAEVRLGWLAEVMAYFRGYFEFPTPNLPRLKLPVDFRDIAPEQIEDAALRCREAWKLGVSPIPDVVQELETNGIAVAAITMAADKLDAFSQLSDVDGTPYVLLGEDKASWARRCFDAAHELGHLALHQKVELRRVNTPADWKLMEGQAHHFARAFLMPAQSFQSDLWAPSLDTFVTLKPKWRASVQSMIFRCQDLGLINAEQASVLWINLNRRGWKKKEPLDDKMAPSKPIMLSKSVEMLVEAKVRKPTQIVDDLCLPPAELEELTMMPRGYFQNPAAEVIPLPRFKAAREAVSSATSEVIELDRFRRA